MILNNYIIFLLLLRCVFVYCKNHTTYTLNPNSSQLKLLSLPKEAMFLGDLHKSSNKNRSRKKINTHFLHENPNDENGEDYYNYEQESPGQSNLNSEDSYNSSGGPSDDNGPRSNYQPDFQGQSQPENGFLDESSSQPLNNQQDTDQVEENKKIVDDIAKEEHMKEMNTNAGQMLDSAKQAKEKADELLNKFKQGQYTTETNKHSMPKDEAGNIIITNTTTTPAPKHEEEKVDPLKSIRDATLSLFERAKHKNLPVSDPGHLSTPEQIYAALNSLEYIIDGYRYSKIDVKDAKNQENNIADSGSTSDVGEGDSQLVSSDDSNTSSSNGGDEEEEENIMDPDRFLQVKHKDDDDEEEEGEGGEDSNDENEEDDKDEDFHRDESEEGGELSDENGSGEASAYEGAGKGARESKGAALTPQQAVEDLKEVLAKLTSVLEQVVIDSVGVRNVIVKSESH